MSRSLEYATQELEDALRAHFPHQGDAENLTRAIRNLVFATLEYERARPDDDPARLVKP